MQKNASEPVKFCVPCALIALELGDNPDDVLLRVPRPDVIAAINPVCSHHNRMLRLDLEGIQLCDSNDHLRYYRTGAPMMDYHNHGVYFERDQWEQLDIRNLLHGWRAYLPTAKDPSICETVTLDGLLGFLQRAQKRMIQRQWEKQNIDAQETQTLPSLKQRLDDARKAKAEAAKNEELIRWVESYLHMKRAGGYIGPHPTNTLDDAGLHSGADDSDGPITNEHPAIGGYEED